MSTRLVVLCFLFALSACEEPASGPDGSIERDAAISDGGGLLDGGPADGGAAMDAGVDAGGPACDTMACDPRDDSACGTGFCSLGSGEPACDESVMPGLLGAGTDCTDTVECSPGLACFMTSTGGTCARPCCPGEGTGCAVGSRCGGAGVLVDSTPTYWGRCLPLRSCEPLRPDETCEGREGCYVIDGSLMTECRIAGSSESGDSCVEQEDCRAGFFCGGLSSSLRCIRLCAVGADDCPTAEGRCVQQAHTPEGVGLCTMDAMTARMNGG